MERSKQTVCRYRASENEGKCERGNIVGTAERIKSVTSKREETWDGGRWAAEDLKGRGTILTKEYALYVERRGDGVTS